MKKNELKGFAKGIILSLLVMSISFSALAAAKTIEVSTGIKLMVDGSAFVPKDVNGNVVEVFGYNGTTYVPIRAIGQAFGKDIGWDDATQTAIVGKSQATGYSRTNPAPVGQSQIIKVDNFMEKYTASVTITESYRGVEAWQKLKSANQFNTPPDKDHEYVLIKVKANATEIADDKSVSFNIYSFTAFSSENVEYPFTSAVDPEPEFSGKVYNNGTLEGYVSFLVNKNDTAPKVVFGEDYDGAGGIWFNISK